MSYKKNNILKKLEIEVIIFCKVIDNFGDAGFCYRIAKCFSLFVKNVFIYTNNIELFEQMKFNKTKILSNRVYKNLKFRNYNLCIEDYCSKNKYFVIELFQSKPPDSFLQLLDSNLSSKRIILDHLTTENWADSFQGNNALDPNLLISLPNKNGPSISRKWFAPGFSKKSSGLPKEEWVKANRRQRELLRKFLLSSPETTYHGKLNDIENVFIICKFTYSNIPFIFNAVPKGFNSVAIWNPKKIVMSQREFDVALQSCDFNIVRGEDSFVSAHYASSSNWKVPFVWQPYPQEKSAHSLKLLGWKSQFSNIEIESYWNFTDILLNQEIEGLSYEWQNIVLNWSELKNLMHLNCSKIFGQKSLIESLIRSFIK